MCYLLSVPLSKVAYVVGKDGEVIRDPVVLAEADYDGQAHPWGRVPSQRRHVQGSAGSHRLVDHLQVLNITLPHLLHSHIKITAKIITLIEQICK